jgi:hypothetical protein
VRRATNGFTGVELREFDPLEEKESREDLAIEAGLTERFAGGMFSFEEESERITSPGFWGT